MTTDPGVTKGYAAPRPKPRDRAAEQVFDSIVRYADNRATVLRPMIRRFDPRARPTTSASSPARS